MNLLTDIAAICGATLVVITFCAALSRLRWVRWVWRRLVSDPFGTWLSTVVKTGARAFHDDVIEPRLAKIERELTTNNGSTLRDEVRETKEIALRAEKIARQLADDRGLPPGVDPTERSP